MANRKLGALSLDSLVNLSLSVNGSSEGNNLDRMLGNLNTDMAQQGVMIVPKGNCAACNNPIVNQVVKNG